MKYVLFAFLIMMPLMAKAEVDPALMAKQAELKIKAIADDAITSLQNTMDDDAARRAEFKRILNDNFDMDALAKFAMGRYWNVATEAERKEYTKLFNKMVIDVYSNRFSDYEDEVIRVTGSKPAGRKDIVVNSLIEGGKQPIKVDWRLRKGKIIDVIVEGVSMSVTQRNDFASVIQQNGGQVSALIDHLKKS